MDEVEIDSLRKNYSRELGRLFHELDRSNSLDKNNCSRELGKLFEALAKAQSEMVPAKTDNTNPFFRSRYADLSSVVRASRAALAKNGLCVMQRQSTEISDDRRIYLLTRLGHSSGQWIESCMPVNPLKQDIQSIGSYLTYLRRYMYASLVGVVSDEDDDGEMAMNASSERSEFSRKAPLKISKKDLKKIAEVLKTSDDYEIVEKTLKKFKLVKFSDLEPGKLYDCINFIKLCKNGD